MILLTLTILISTNGSYIRRSYPTLLDIKSPHVVDNVIVYSSNCSPLQSTEYNNVVDDDIPIHASRPLRPRLLLHECTIRCYTWNTNTQMHSQPDLQFYLKF